MNNILRAGLLLAFALPAGAATDGKNADGSGTAVEKAVVNKSLLAPELEVPGIIDMNSQLVLTAPGSVEVAMKQIWRDKLFRGVMLVDPTEKNLGGLSADALAPQIAARAKRLASSRGGGAGAQSFFNEDAAQGAPGVLQDFGKVTRVRRVRR